MLILAACSPSGIDSIQRESLFSLDIGPMEDQVALYNLEGDGGVLRANITMHDGLFYIVDGSGGKIVHYNSYGDLLFMVYNNETNPEPVSLKAKTDDNVQLTRWTYTYPLRSPGRITVDSRKHIYVEERLPNERHDYDAQNRTLQDSVILHFDADGRFIEYLGQGGQGGVPFPRITGLYSSVQDEVAIVCRLSTGWNVHWFSQYGEQLYMIQINNAAIPAPADWPGFSASVNAIFAAPDARKLYIKVDYYRDVVDESTNIRVSTEPVSSLIWIFNVEERSYENHVEIPFYEHSYTERGRTVTVRMLYTLIGITREGGILLSFPTDTGYTVLRMDSNGLGQRRSFINVSPEELRFNSFYLSPEGILCALLADDWKINVVWWRMDRFMRDSP